MDLKFARVFGKEVKKTPNGYSVEFGINDGEYIRFLFTIGPRGHASCLFHDVLQICIIFETVKEGKDLIQEALKEYVYPSYRLPHYVQSGLDLI